MKNIKIIFILALLLVTAACANGMTRVGNPPEPVPSSGDQIDQGGLAGDDTSAIEKYIGENNFKGNSFGAAFDTENGTVTISSINDDSVKLVLGYKISNGAVTTVDDGNIKLVGLFDRNSLTVNIKIIQVQGMIVDELTPVENGTGTMIEKTEQAKDKMAHSLEDCDPDELKTPNASKIPGDKSQIPQVPSF